MAVALRGDWLARAAVAVLPVLAIALAGCGPDPRYSEPMDLNRAGPGGEQPKPVVAQERQAPPAAPSGPAPSPADELYPRHVGDKWEMARTAGIDAETITTTVLGSRTELGMTAFTMETRGAGGLQQTEGYLADDTGVYRVSTGPDGSGRIEPRMPMLRLPFKPSDSWAWQGELVGGGAATKAKAKFYLKPQETVKTKAGEFKAYRWKQLLTLELPEGAQTIETTMWLAPGVGLVKQETTDATGLTSAELTRYQVKR